MTFVGKILVILITLFAMFFLAVSTVVFTTEKNWKADRDKVKEALTKETNKLNDVTASLERANTQRATALDDFNQQTKTFKDQIADLEKQRDLALKAQTETNNTAAVAQEAQREALHQAEQRTKETLELREILTGVQKQANEFKLRQAELLDEIRTLKRDLEVAQRNNADLRDRVGAFASELRKHSLSDDYQQIKGATSVAPEVDGIIKRVDAKGQRVEISIGSNDGLVVGHELDVYRKKPAPDYIGRIRIEAVDPDQAVGIVIGKTVQGKKIQEGDIVASKISSR